MPDEFVCELCAVAEWLPVGPGLVACARCRVVYALPTKGAIAGAGHVQVAFTSVLFSPRDYAESALTRLGSGSDCASGRRAGRWDAVCSV